MEQKNEGISEEQLEEIRTQAKERALLAKHSWVQRGGWIVCTACTNQHAMRIDGTQRMTGVKNGMPVIERSDR